MEIGEIVDNAKFDRGNLRGQFSLSIERLSEWVAAGQPVVVRLVITNTTDSVQSLEFTETHAYHKTLPYPTCIAAHLLGENGKNHCQYPTQYILWATLFTKEDSKYIDIKPGAVIIRDLNINAIVSGCDCSQDKGLAPGTYYVSLSVHESLTNELKIVVR